MPCQLTCARCRLCKEKEQQAQNNPHLPKRRGRPIKASPKRAKQKGVAPEAAAEGEEEGLSGGVSKSDLLTALAVIQEVQQQPSLLQSTSCSACSISCSATIFILYRWYALHPLKTVGNPEFWYCAYHNLYCNYATPHTQHNLARNPGVHAPLNSCMHTPCTPHGACGVAILPTCGQNATPWLPMVVPTTGGLA